MKKIIVPAVLLFLALIYHNSQPVHVGQGHWEWSNPNAKFSTSKNFTTQSTVTWRPVDDVQGTCERESKARGLGGFGYGVQACSFWNGSSCTIFTAKSASLHNLGHEALHCFQGNYH